MPESDVLYPTSPLFCFYYYKCLIWLCIISSDSMFSDMFRTHGLQSTALKPASLMTLWTPVTLKRWSNIQFDFFLIMNLTEICDNAKKGREYALLGNYDSSMVYYQGVIQQIHKHCLSLRDPALKVKWQQVRLWFNLICVHDHLYLLE